MKAVELRKHTMSPKICIIFIFASVCSTAHSIVHDPPKPTFGKVFSVQIEAIFPTENAAAEATLYFDLSNNRAAINLLYQNELTKQIYRFPKDELISVKGTVCSVDKIGDNSFFPYEVTKTGKFLKPAENLFYFTNSTYSAEDLHGFVPEIVYNGVAKVEFLDNAQCELVHKFTKPDFSMPDCEFQHCQSTLMSIMVTCEEANVGQQYNFYNFQNSVDSSVFEIPAGVHCNVESDEKFPDLPRYASFSYDIIHIFPDADYFEGTQVIHKSVWYDQELQLFRADEHAINGITTIRIFDFKQGRAVTIIPNQACTPGPVSKDMTMEKITELPDSIFPQKLRVDTATPVFSGKRKAAGVNYKVWTLKTEVKNEGIIIVKDLYYIEVVEKVIGFSKQMRTQPSFVQMYDYVYDDDPQDYKITETTYAPINHYRTSPRDLLVFGVSDCFTKEQKMLFELEMAGASLQEGTDEYLDFVEKVYSALLNAANVPLSRIDKLKVVFNENDIIVFQGVIVESLDVDKSTETTKSPDMRTIFTTIETKVSSQAFTVNVTSPQKVTYNATYFGNLRRLGESKSAGYTKSFVGSLGFGMLLMGIIIGVVALFVYFRLKEKKQPHLPYSTME